MGVIGFNGGIVGPDNTPTTSVASGVWTLDELFNARDAGIWPTLFVPVPVEYLVVAGGGGGGSDRGGGGGGGYHASGLLSQALISTIAVGAGGPGVFGASFDRRTGNDGNASTFDSFSSSGGERGNRIISGNVSIRGGDGGSGGGGGNGTNNSRNLSGGSNGGNGSGSAALNGGVGGVGQATATQSSITGANVLRCGGGGGGSFESGSNRSGGGGGGGNGGRSGLMATAGGQNTGGGGGGGGAAASSESGGSGVVIIRYADTFQDLLIGSGLQYRDSGGSTVTGTGVRVAPSYSPSGFKVYQFNGGTGNIEF